MGDFGKAPAGVNQFTKHLYPCFGIGFHNKKNGESYMLHDYHNDNYISRLKNNIETVKNDFKDIRNIKVYANGFTPLDQSDNKLILRDRKRIEKILKRSFLKENITINWNEKETPSNFYLFKDLPQFYVQKFNQGDLEIPAEELINSAITELQRI